MKRVIIYGFGEAGKQVADDILKNRNFEILAFLDDDKNKWNLEYENIKVVGDINSIKKLDSVDSLIIAMPSASIQRIREIEMQAIKLGIKDIKIVPSYYVNEERVFLKHVVEVDIFDIFKKREIEIDYEALKLFYENKSILITGGAGSIGSHLVKEILNFNVKKVIAMDIDETRLYELSNDLEDGRLSIYLGDITDDYCLYEVFQNHIDIVFHCAAYKHVPILENFEYMAYKVNFIGTKKLIEFSKRKGIEKFIFISTDKAVEPKSIMGKTKSMAENLVIENNYIAVRFGNVLNSRGSLIPTILKQVQKGYVKITHKDAKRYFITPKEAILLILYSPIISNGKDILVLDMGEPINIKDAIENLLKLLGYEPYKDIKIIFTDLRKGEKLEEKLFSSNEILEVTENPFIYKVKKLSGEGGI